MKDKAEKAFDDKTDAQTVLDGEKFDLNAAHELFKRLKLKLAQMQKEYDGLRHEMYGWQNRKVFIQDISYPSCK